MMHKVAAILAEEGLWDNETWGCIPWTEGKNGYESRVAEVHSVRKA